MTDGASCCDPAVDAILHADTTEVALRLSIAGFVALWRGRAPHTAELLPDASGSAAATAAALAEGGRAELDEDGRVVGIHGLTLRTTRHSFEHARVVRHTWCAFDSVGIPAALHLDATARSDCPTCGRTIALEISGGRVDVDRLVLWLPNPDASSHLMNDFCAAADVYCSPEHLEQRIGPRRVAGRVATVDEAVALGRATWAEIVDLDLNDSRHAKRARG